jgi:hypothetical protein
MEQNNFEKDIQQKMGELKIAPSDSVWPNIEKHIGKKKKERRAIFIIIAFLLFLSLGGLWFINSKTNNQQKNEPIANILEKGSKPTNNPDSSLKQKLIDKGIFSKSDTASIISKNSKIKINSVEKNTFNPKKLIITSSKNKSALSRRTKNEENYFVTDNKNNSSTKKDGIIETKIKEEVASLQNENKNDSLTEQSKIPNIKKETAPTKDSLTKINQKKNKKHPWNFGVTFSVGTSVRMKNSIQANYLNTYGNITAGGIPVGYSNPSEVKSSASFNAGVFLEKNISDKNKISFGISYQYFSFVNKVGSTIVPSGNNLSLNSSGNFYGVGNTFKSYRNQFHFLEIPVSFNFRINKSKNVPIFWNAGINVSELISSNALQFQSNPGMYYHDNSLLNKTQFGLHTGFSVILFTKEKTPITIGPYFYYSPTNIANKGLYGKTHFSSFGIRAEMLFRKK